MLINKTCLLSEQVEECVDCILDEADLHSSLNIQLLKTRRDVWQELCRQRRLRSGSEEAEAASASDLNQPLSSWLDCMHLGQYCAQFEARGLLTTLQVRIHALTACPEMANQLRCCCSQNIHGLVSTDSHSWLATCSGCTVYYDGGCDPERVQHSSAARSKNTVAGCLGPEASLPKRHAV